MILIDYSSIMHRMIYVSVSNVKQNKLINSTGIKTSDFINLAKHMVLEEIIEIQKQFSAYGNIVLCLDDFSKRYWRRDYFPAYKQNRAKGREESELNYTEIFAEFNELTNMIIKYLPWKVISVPGAEADDIMLILAREYGTRGEKILLHTPDKDMIQAQIDNPNVQQYSALTKKWIVPENKHDNMEHWILEHVFLGDDSDGVPRVIDDTVFSDNFIEHLKNNGVKELTPWEFKASSLSSEEKRKIIGSFNIYKHNKKGEKTELDIYKKERFGSSGLEKKLKEFGSIDKYLDSHPMYRKNYERNRVLVLEEGIPNNIRNEIIVSYISAEDNYNKKELLNFLEKYNMNSFKTNLSFFEKEELSIDNCGW